MNIFSIFIPKGRSKELKELESWTVSWKVATCLEFGEWVKYHKVFLSEGDARAFKAELEISADFLGTTIRTKIKKN